MIEFKLNGKLVRFEGNPLTRLIDVIREDLDLTGTKEGCGEGECGACSVLRNGKLVTSCIIPVGAVAGDEITTIEGLRDTPQGQCIIDAFAEGGLLLVNSDPDEDEVRAAISGNICRCTGYDLIVDSILLAAKKGKGLW